jgi:hypothetical protein
MPLLITAQEIANMKQWVIQEMEADKPVEVNEKQIEGFKRLMDEWYGWPEFSLNFLKDMKHVIKIML